MKVMMLVHEKIITTFFQEPLENNVMVNSLQMIGRSKKCFGSRCE